MPATYTQNSCTEARIHQGDNDNKNNQRYRLKTEKPKKSLCATLKCHNCAFFLRSFEDPRRHQAPSLRGVIKTCSITSRIMCALLKMCARNVRNVASPSVANVDPSGPTASAATTGLVRTSPFFSSFLTFPFSFFFVPPEHLSPSALPLSTPPTPSQPLIRPLTAASPASPPHYIARCAFLHYFKGLKRHILDASNKRPSPWRAPRIKRPTRRTCPAGRTPSTTRGPGS